MNSQTIFFGVDKSTNDRLIISILAGTALAATAYLLCRALGNDGARVLCAVVGTAGWLYAGAAVISGRVTTATLHFVLAVLAFALALRALTQPVFLPVGFALHALYAFSYPLVGRYEPEAAGSVSVWGVFSAVMAILTTNHLG